MSIMAVNDEYKYIYLWEHIEENTYRRNGSGICPTLFQTSSNIELKLSKITSPLKNIKQQQKLIVRPCILVLATYTYVYDMYL